MKPEDDTSAATLRPAGAAGAVVRAAEPADVAAVLRLIREIPTLPQWQADSLAVPTEALPEQAASELRRALLIAEVDGSFAGFAQWSALLGEAELEGMAVTPERRRAGVGRMLLRQVFEQSRSASCEVVRLEVRSGNGAAVGLYRSEGFCIAGRRAHYYTHPVEDALQLEYRPPK